MNGAVFSLSLMSAGLFFLTGCSRLTNDYRAASILGGCAVVVAGFAGACWGRF